MTLRVLVVGAGAPVSTKDVETGYCEALDAAGLDVHLYALGARLETARGWLIHQWRTREKLTRGKDPQPRPTEIDAVYRGSVEALEMALRFRVDWVLIISGMFFHPDVIEMMRRAGLRTAVILTESPYEDAKQALLAHLVDVCWTNERTSVERLRLANARVRYLRHAYDPLRHAALGGVTDDLPRHDVVLVGTGFAERIELLEGVDWSGIDLGLYGQWQRLGSRSKLRPFVRAGAVSNERAVALYRAAKIGLNPHRTSTHWGKGAPRVTDAESMNPRAYELAAAGCFQLADPRAELVETFGEAVPTFSDCGELSELVHRFLDGPAVQRHELAALARQRVLPHTFAARAAQVLAELESDSTAAHARGA